MTPADLALMVLRLCRKRGLTLRVEHHTDTDVTLRVTPKAKMTPYIKMAIPRCKAELIALLDAEPSKYVRVEDEAGELVRALIDTGPCETCGGNDRAATADGTDTYCVTCATSVEVLQGQVEQELLELRWKKGDAGAPETTTPAHVEQGN